MTPAQLRDARESLGLSQQGLAEALDVHRVTVARWETGQDTIPRLVTLAMEALAHQARGRRREGD
jgi:transcriptional regulator with XRE-family HTH domain